jgi:hypothetical protein
MKSIIKFINKFSLLMVKYFIQNLCKIQHKKRLYEQFEQYEFKH